MRNTDWPLVIAITITCAFIAALCVLPYFLTVWDCSGYQSATGKPTKMASLSCFVQDAGKWYSMEEYKNRLFANGSKL